MSGLKIVLKLNRPKPAVPTAGEDASQPAAAAEAPFAAARAPPVSVAPVVAEQPSATDGRSHGHKEKKEKKKHKHKHGERDRVDHAAPADGGEPTAVADGEPPKKKAKKHKDKPPGAIAVPPAHHLSATHLPGATAAAGTPAAVASAEPGTSAAAPNIQPNTAAAVPVKLKLKAPKLLIKGSFGHAVESGTVGAGGDSATKKQSQQHSAQQPSSAAPAGLASPGGGEERKQRKKRQREAHQQQRPGLGPKHSAPMMAGLITPSVSEQGGGGGAASTAQGGAASGGLATPSSAAPASSAQAVDSKPAAGASERKMLDRVIEKLSKKDPHRIFQRPVTDDEAPGYSAMISRPMAFNTIRAKLAAGEYDGDKAWDDLQQDMATMFTNAMTYNPPDTFVHKQAKSLLEFANKVVELGRQGVTDFRGRTNSIARAHNAAIAEEERQAREAQRSAERAAKVAERNGKMRQRAVIGGVVQPTPGSSIGQPYQQHQQQQQQRVYSFGPEVSGVAVDDTVRNTYHQKSRDALFADFKGLAFGTNAEGVSWTQGRLGLQPTAPEPKAGVVHARLEAFARRLAGRAAELARAQLQSCRTIAVA